MKLISKNRGEGKTTELIKMSAKTGYRIVVHSDYLVKDISNKAKMMNLNIPTPISKREINSSKFQGETFLIDELELFIEDGINVYAATINNENIEETIEENSIVRMKKVLNKLTLTYDKFIDRGNYNESLNILKNIEILNHQLKDIGYEKLHSIYEIMNEKGEKKQLITLWEQNCFGDMRNVQTWVISEKYNDTLQNWVQGLSNNWDNLRDDIKSDVIHMF